jgi:hypothetical protein
VRLIESGDTVTAAFSEKVKNTIRIRQRQLVAIDTSKAPPEIAWRWFIGEVESLDGGNASIRRLDMPPGSCALIANADGVAVSPGDIVYYVHGDGSYVAAKVVGDGPAEPRALADRYLPRIKEFLTQ